MLLDVDGLRYEYGDRHALNGLSFRVEPGALFGVLGPNGSGKSTLFKILSTLLAPQHGRVTLAGFDIAREPTRARRKMGVVFQTCSLDKGLTVEENLLAQGSLYGLSGTRLRSRVSRALEEFHLSDRRKDLAGALSGGLKRKVEIAKALLSGPELLLLDEASTGLDPAARRELAAILERLVKDHGTTVLFITHLTEEAERATRLIMLHEGRKILEGTPAELKARVSGDVVIFRGTRDGLAAAIAGKFAVKPVTEAGMVRVETPDGHRFAADVIEALPGFVDAVEFHKPTLDDVFIDETGAKLDG